MAISQRLRHEIMRRDGFRCAYCKTVDKPLEVDHVVPKALGGNDDPSNLITACNDCNAGKSSVHPDAPLVAAVADSAKEWADTLAQVAEERRGDDPETVEAQERVANVWTKWVPADWEHTIELLCRSGMTPGDLERMARYVMAKSNIQNYWLYFCKCCWNEIGTRQELAAERLGKQPPAPTIANSSQPAWLPLFSDSDVEEGWETDDSLRGPESIEWLRDLGTGLADAGVSLGLLRDAAHEALGYWSSFDADGTQRARAAIVAGIERLIDGCYQDAKAPIMVSSDLLWEGDVDLLILEAQAPAFFPFPTPFVPDRGT